MRDNFEKIMGKVQKWPELSSQLSQAAAAVSQLPKLSFNERRGRRRSRDLRRQKVFSFEILSFQLFFPDQTKQALSSICGCYLVV